MVEIGMAKTNVVFWTTLIREDRLRLLNTFFCLQVPVQTQRRIS
jgi:hypothetical protein